MEHLAWNYLIPNFSIISLTIEQTFSYHLDHQIKSSNNPN
jgi:hypothetical protein